MSTHAVKVARARPGTARRSGLGLSVVELMVGIAIGLFVLAGATVMATSQLSDNRRMLLDMQVQQDLRAATDLIVRGVRRAGYYARAAARTWPDSTATLGTNPYADLTWTASSIVFHASQDERGTGNPIGSDNDTLDANEYMGFRHDATNQTIEVQVSQGNWQTLTDPNVVKIPVGGFVVNVTEEMLDAPCGATCPTGPTGCPMKLRLRTADIDITAEAAHDSSIKRSLSTSVRLRNDVLEEDCP